jgi:hypothetical protein
MGRFNIELYSLILIFRHDFKPTHDVIGDNLLYDRELKLITKLENYS